MATRALLPCKVCLDPSSGLHYGVLSCDACKGFFGRQLRSKRKSQRCAKNQVCKITGSDKTNCPPCRFKKCLRVGMSRQAITTGRYSLQRLERMHIEVRERENRRLQPEEDLQSRLSPSLPVGPRGERLQEVLAAISKSYALLPSSLHWSQEDLDGKVVSYWEQYTLKQGLFGKLPMVSSDEFMEIFRETGLDIDDRIKFKKLYLSCVRQWLRKLVHFAKSIPGFKELSFRDQFHLIKYNRFEFWFLGAYRGYNAKLETCVNPNGVAFHKEEIRKAYPGDAHEVIFQVAENLRRIKLTTEEHIIAQTMSLVFPDRAPLEDRSAVEGIQTTLLTCLEHLVSKRPTQQDRVRAMSHAVDMLTTIRSLCHVDEPTDETYIEHMQALKLNFLTMELLHTQEES